MIKEGLSIYQVYNNPLMISERKKRDCTYCFKSSENNLHVYPLISEYHIKSYDFENQKIELTKAGKQIIDRLKIYDYRITCIFQKHFVSFCKLID